MKLEHEHHPTAIQRRLQSERKHNYIGDAILGAIDGCVTTFAIVAGALGGQLVSGIALLLGTSNLLADGLSMAVGNFQKTKSERELVEKIRKTEERHILHIPEGEREEIRQIFERKGFKDPVLEEIVKGITKDKKLWVDTMITEEYGFPLEGAVPWKSGFVTFLAFIGVGAVPLIPFLLSSFWKEPQMYQFSMVMTGTAFFGVGLLKGVLVKRPPLSSGLETLFVGSLAASLAFLVGAILRRFIMGL